MIRTSPSTREWLLQNYGRHLTRLQDFLRQPTMPSEGVGLRDGAEVVASILREVGCTEVQLIEGFGNPGVWGYYNAGAPRTLMTYCMFDTKGVDPSKWPTPPFDASLSELRGLGTAVVAPGAKGRKGPFVQFINALEAVRAVDGELPVNVMFLAEGEENIGSPHYASYVEKFAHRIREATACHCPGAAQDASGDVTVNLGFKGMILGRLIASGERMGRGPQAAPSHSMAQGLVASPAWRLIEALGTLATDDGQRVLIDGFYDDERPPTDQERAEIERLTDGHPEPWWTAIPGVRDAKLDAGLTSKMDAWLRYLYEPSLNISGLRAGYVGPGSPMFATPNEAWAILDIRLPRGFNTKRTIDRLRSHLRMQSFDDVEFEVTAAHEPMSTSPSSSLMATVAALVQEHGARLKTVPTSAGGGPWSLFEAEFGMPVLFDVGLGLGGKAGEAGEFLVVDGASAAADMVECEVFYAEMIRRWAVATEG